MFIIGNRGWIKTEVELRNAAEKNDDLSNKGAYLNLMSQLNKVARHAKGISVNKSLPQYYSHMDLFCRFLADNYNLKTLANIQNKHLIEYVIERQSEGKSAATVKNDLAAIRYFHDQIPQTRYLLSSNQVLSEKNINFNLERRRFGGIDRRPTNLEYQAFISLAKQTRNPEIAFIIILGKEMGLRIHEAVRLSRSDVERAFRESFLTVKGKGGLIRQVPLNDVAITTLEAAIQNISRGQKIFVPPSQKAHQVIQRVQDFIKNNRQKIIDPLNSRPKGIEITMHSFRHAYAKEQYDSFIFQGHSEDAARLKVAQLIGHNRDDVTKIYLAETRI
ncbi:tyrosine-type recombinase/integrase [Lysinibacillus fusiformis]